MINFTGPLDETRVFARVETTDGRVELWVAKGSERGDAFRLLTIEGDGSIVVDLFAPFGASMLSQMGFDMVAAAPSLERLLRVKVVDGRGEVIDGGEDTGAPGDALGDFDPITCSLDKLRDAITQLEEVGSSLEVRLVDKDLGLDETRRIVEVDGGLLEALELMKREAGVEASEIVVGGARFRRVEEEPIESSELEGG